MKRLVMLLVIALISVGVICAVSAENAKLYTTGNVLAAGNYNNSATSSDLTLIIKMTAGDKVLVDEGSAVMYTVPTADIAGWTTKSFNDSAWTAGVSGVGYADSDDNTTITGPVPSIYTRYHFDAPNASSVKEVTFLVDYDDFYIIWLNGVEVARYDPIKDIAPGGVPAWDEVTKKGVTDHESSDTAAGKPNAARWDKPQGAAAGQIAKHVVAVDLGAVVSAVNATAKLATAWGEIKSAR
jgi:hypothetical protein